MAGFVQTSLRSAAYLRNFLRTREAEHIEVTASIDISSITRR